MKRLLIMTYLIFGLILAGSDGIKQFEIVTPHGTTFGYVYPDGDFRLDGPGKLHSEGKVNPNEPLFDSTFGYRHGDSYTIIQPNGEANFMYDLERRK